MGEAQAPVIPLDVVIFGGGVAGLWLLDELHRGGYQCILVESVALGQGQTIASQGIIHGGVKYSLQGLVSQSAENIRDMPRIWRHCLEGLGRPHIGNTIVRAQACHLWRTGTMMSKIGLVGATHALNTKVVSANDDRPTALGDVPGQVFRVEEQVICPRSLLADLGHQTRFRSLLVNPEEVHFEQASDGCVERVHLASGDMALELEPKAVALMAGSGNAALREQLGLAPNLMQRRPLHMVMARGELPKLFGHCVDGAKTRATITSDRDKEGRTVWLIGGQISEVGVGMSGDELIAYAATELRAVVPGIDWSGVELATYRVDRAERATKGLLRPDTCTVDQDANIITAWPTKLVLAPVLTNIIKPLLHESGNVDRPEVGLWSDWPRPRVATLPWRDPNVNWTPMP